MGCGPGTPTPTPEVICTEVAPQEGVLHVTLVLMPDGASDAEAINLVQGANAIFEPYDIRIDRVGQPIELTSKQRWERFIPYDINGYTFVPEAGDFAGAAQLFLPEDWCGTDAAIYFVPKIVKSS